MQKTKDPIGELLLKTRKERDISVPELAGILGIPKDRIYKWEQGESTPKYQDRVKLEAWIKDGSWRNIPDEVVATQVSEPSVEYNKAPAYGDPAFLAGRLFAKEEVLAEKEARRLDAERRADLAEKEKDRLLTIIEQNLTALQVNSAATLKQLSKVIRVMRADDGEMMDGQDRIQGLAVGTTATRAGTVELAHERAANIDRTKDDQGKTGKTGKQSKA